MAFHTPDFIQKHGIVLSKNDVPFEAVLIFNAGVSRTPDGYVMLFRNDYNFCRKDYDDFYAGISDNTVPKTNIGLAFSQDGVHWKVEGEPVFPLPGNGITRIYDPRITALGDGRYGICFAANSDWGIRGGIAVTKDFHAFDIQSLSVPDNRNMVLFPEKVAGKYVRLERPFAGGDFKKYGIWLSTSPDLISWGESQPVMMPKDVPYVNSKIGPAAPPVRTKDGWLTLFHAVEEVKDPMKAWERSWTRRYYAGAMLLDLENPSKILAMAKKPLLVPEEPYECDGYRGEVIFPGGLILDDGICKIYYGSADTVECLATASLKDMLDFVKAG